MASPGRKRTLSTGSRPWLDDAARKRHRLPETCEWIRRQPAYQAWKSWDESASPVLWIQGPVGIGKTFLADFIASDIDETGPNSTVLTSYCTARSTPVSIVHGLAAQLVQSDKISESVSAKLDNLVKNSSPDQGAVPYDAIYRVWDGLTSTIEESPRLSIVVDGLDEVPDEFLSHQKFNLSSKLVELTTILAGNVRLLVLSRPQASILRVLRDSPIIQVTATKVSEDISRFCLSEVAKYPQLGQESDLVSSTLARKSEGIFVWASLAIKVLGEQAGGGNIPQLLERLPGSLDGMYEEAFRQQVKDLSETHTLLRDIILRWLVLSVRPMTAPEIANAISTETGMFITDLEAVAAEICGSLIKFEDGYVKLVHHSLREFLHRQPTESDQETSAWSSENNLSITKSLLGYLSSQPCANLADVTDPKEFSELWPLAEYATLYWAHHLSLSKSDKGLESQIELFFQSDNAAEWVAKLFPTFLPSSVHALPPRPPINARFFHLAILKSQIVNFFDESKQTDMNRSLDSWHEGVYEKRLAEVRGDGRTNTPECLQRWIELAELYSWLPERGDRVAPQLKEAIEAFSSLSSCRDLIFTAKQALADDLKRNGHYAEAQELLESLIQGISEHSPEQNAALSFAYDSLGWVCSRQDKLQEAEKSLELALELSTQQFGSSSPHTLRSRLTLAEVLVRLGRDEEAKPLYGTLEKQLLENERDEKQTLPKDSIAHLNILGGIYMLQGEFGKARDTFHVVVEQRKRILRGESRLTLWAEMQYGLAVKGTGDVEEAEAILSNLLPRQVRILGSEHQDVKDVTKALEDIREKL